MSEQSFNSMQNEISLKDMIDFLVEYWKTIILAGILGLLSSMANLWMTPSEYQATAQIQMAQISASSNNNNNNNNNPLGVNIEEPKLLLARLKMPTAYTDIEIKACGLSNQHSSAETLISLAKFYEVKGVVSIIELKVSRPTKDH